MSREDRLRPVTGVTLYRSHLPYYQTVYKSNVLLALASAEGKKDGQPVYYVEIFKAFLGINWIPLPAAGLVFLALLDLYREDKVLADREMHKFTLNPAF